MRSRTTYCETSLLQSVGYQIQEVHKLAEHDAFGSRVLLAEVTEFLDEGLDLRRRPPLVEIKPPEYALTLCGRFIEFESRGLEVDGEGNVADRTCGLDGRVNAEV